MATASLSVSLSCVDSKNTPFANYSGNPSIAVSSSLSGSQIATGIYLGGGTISTATSVVVNNGSLSSTYGAALTYSTVQEVVVYNTSATATIVVGGGTDPLFGSDSYTLQPGQCLAVPNVPITVSSTAKQITLTPSASATYQMMVVG